MLPIGNHLFNVLLCAPNRVLMSGPATLVRHPLTFTPYQVMINREQVLEIVKGHLVDTIEELEGVEIDPSRSMKDLGANSLDIVEVVSCSMRDLKIKVPRSELNTLENMNQRVDLLFRVATEKQAAQA